MKLFLFISLLLMISAVEEPEPINDFERSDEVAQAQDRAKWIACLTIASSTIDSHKQQIQENMSKFKHSFEVVVKKIAADVLEACEKKITWRIAEDFLGENNSKELQALIQEVDKVELLQFEGESVKFNDRQKELIEKIVSEMNRIDDGFDMSPPVVKEVVEANQKSLWVYGVLGLLGLVAIWVISGLFSSSTEDTKQKVQDKGKKKRE